MLKMLDEFFLNMLDFLFQHDENITSSNNNIKTNALSKKYMLISVCQPEKFLQKRCTTTDLSFQRTVQVPAVSETVQVRPSLVESPPVGRSFWSPSPPDGRSFWSPESPPDGRTFPTPSSVLVTRNSSRREDFPRGKSSRREEFLVTKSSRREEFLVSYHGTFPTTGRGRERPVVGHYLLSLDDQKGSFVISVGTTSGSTVTCWVWYTITRKYRRGSSWCW